MHESSPTPQSPLLANPADGGSKAAEEDEEGEEEEEEEEPEVSFAPSSVPSLVLSFPCCKRELEAKSSLERLATCSLELHW